MKPPCKKCDKRHIGCHSDCEEYKKYKTEQRDIYRERDKYNDYIDALIDSYKRMKRKQTRRK